MHDNVAVCYITKTRWKTTENSKAVGEGSWRRLLGVQPKDKLKITETLLERRKLGRGNSKLKKALATMTRSRSACVACFSERERETGAKREERLYIYIWFFV